MLCAHACRAVARPAQQQAAAADSLHGIIDGRHLLCKRLFFLVVSELANGKRRTTEGRGRCSRGDQGARKFVASLMFTGGQKNQKQALLDSSTAARPVQDQPGPL